MDFCKKINKKFVCIGFLIFFILFYLVPGYCVEEETVSFNVVPGLQMASSSDSVFTSYSSSTRGVAYFPLEYGYSYTIVNSSNSLRILGMSSSVPTLGGDYSFLGRLPAGSTYTYVPSYNDFMYFDIFEGDSISVTRIKYQGMEGAMSLLVNDVGISNLWSIFDVSVNYIVVVVLFSIGVYIIFRLIRKLSKGKSASV